MTWAGIALAVLGVDLSMSNKVVAADAPSEATMLKYCRALGLHGVDALRKALNGPLPTFSECPDGDFMLADMAVRTVPKEQWPAFLQLAPEADRQRLWNMRLGYVLELISDHSQLPEVPAAIGRLLDAGAQPVGRDGHYDWLAIGRLLETLELKPAVMNEEQRAQLLSVFRRMLELAPAERDAKLDGFWDGMLQLPEPQLLETARVLKQKFGSFSPSAEALRASPKLDYPLKQSPAAQALRQGLSNAVVLALLDLRRPAPPDAATWSAAIDAGRIDLVQHFVQEHDPVPLERDGEVWLTPFFDGVRALGERGDARALDLLLGASPPPMPGDVYDRVLASLLFAQAKAPATLDDATRWRYVDRLIALGASPTRFFGDPANARNGRSIIDLIQRKPQVAVGLLHHRLDPAAPLQPSGGNMLCNYLMTVDPRYDQPLPSIELIREMLKVRDTLNTYDPGVKHFPIEFAVMNYTPDYAQQFARLGVDLKVRDPSGYSLLVRAATFGYLKMVQFLLDAGANPNERSADGLTPLDYAQCRSHHDVVSLLQQRHATPGSGQPDCAAIGRGAKK